MNTQMIQDAEHMAAKSARAVTCLLDAQRQRHVPKIFKRKTGLSSQGFRRHGASMHKPAFMHAVHLAQRVLYVRTEVVANAVHMSVTSLKISILVVLVCLCVVCFPASLQGTLVSRVLRRVLGFAHVALTSAWLILVWFVAASR